MKPAHDTCHPAIVFSLGALRIPLSLAGLVLVSGVGFSVGDITKRGRMLNIAYMYGLSLDGLRCVCVCMLCECI